MESVKKKECAVIISAYKAEDFIEECIESYNNQSSLDGWNYTLRIGVDGCEDTAKKLEELGVPYYWSFENHGPYLIRNSLIELNRVDAYAIFDADDIMLQDYLSTLIELAEDDKIAGAARRDFTRRRVDPISKNYHCGVSVIPDNVWKTLGGFHPWRITADWEFNKRAKKLGVRVVRTKTVLFHRRLHPNSLTMSKETHLYSAYRKGIKAKALEEIQKGTNLVVVPETVPLEFRG